MIVALLLAAGVAMGPSLPMVQATAPASAPVDPAQVAAALQLIELTGFEATLDRVYLPLAPLFAQSVIGAMSNDPQGKAAIAAIQARENGQNRLIAILSQEFLTAVKKTYPEMKRRAAQDYAAAFTADELNSITAFYRSGPGAKALRLLPELQQKSAMTGRELGQKAGMEAGQRGFERAAREILGTNTKPKA